VSQTFTPYIMFPGNADEVFHYYQAIFGGELQIGHYSDVDTSKFPFDPPAEAVSHAELDGGLIHLAGGDGIAGPGRTLPPLDSDVYSFLIGLDSVPEAEALIAKLTGTGATVSMPFALAPWGDHYGQVTDRFGVMWAIVVPGTR
jgi:PhnB protein